MSVLADFKRHADRYGPEFIFETAVLDGLHVVDLSSLANHLRRRGWKLPAAYRQRLLAALVADDQLQDWQIADRLGISKSTVRRARHGGLDPANPAPDSASHGGYEIQNGGGEQNHPDAGPRPCRRCGEPVGECVGRGRPREFCGDGCRVAWHRDRRVVA